MTEQQTGRVCVWYDCVCVLWWRELIKEEEAAERQGAHFSNVVIGETEKRGQNGRYVQSDCVCACMCV